ncbi:MAG: cupin domain-containing protein [Deltaproteobacteria bacterium]
MTTPYTLLNDLARQIEPPADGTLSRTIHQDDRLKAVLFGFSAGQELSEHTSSTPAVMYFLSGEAEVGLGEDTVSAVAGTWIHMPARLPHRIRAKTPVTMLLLLLKQP